MQNILRNYEIMNIQQSLTTINKWFLLLVSVGWADAILLSTLHKICHRISRTIHSLLCTPAPVITHHWGRYWYWCSISPDWPLSCAVWRSMMMMMMISLSYWYSISPWPLSCFCDAPCRCSWYQAHAALSWSGATLHPLDQTRPTPDWVIRGSVSQSDGSQG